MDVIAKRYQAGLPVRAIAERFGISEWYVQKVAAEHGLRRSGPRSNWTPEREDQLKELWSKGLSADQCSIILGGVSRNAICGKVHRMGLEKRATGKRGPHHVRRQRERAALPPPRERMRGPKLVTQAKRQAARQRGNVAFRQMLKADTRPVSTEELVIPPAERVSLLDLEANHCRWPIGDPQHADFHFCGRTPFGGMPYCEHHARRAYQAPQPRERKQPPAYRIVGSSP